MFLPSFRHCSLLPGVILVTAFLTVGIPLATLAQTGSAAPISQSADKVVVHEGTQVHFSLLKDLKSGGNKAGEEIPFEVAKDVYGPGHILLIPSDTPAFGKLLQSNRRGMFGQSDKLKFTIDYILAGDKTHIPLRANA